MLLTGKRIAILVAEGVEDLEYYVPYMRLREEGADVITAGLEVKPVHGKNGLEITPESLAFYDIHLNYVVEPGEFEIMVGSSSSDADLQKTILTVTK